MLTSRIRIATSLEADSELTLPRHEHKCAEKACDDGPGRTTKQHAGGWRMATQRLAIPTRDGEQRVEHLEDLHIFWQTLHVVDHWREVQPDTDEVRQEACDVAEVDLQGAKDHGKPEPERQSLGHHGDGPQHV